LDEFTAEEVTELLNGHGQQLFIEDLEEQAKEIRYKKEKKEKR
jgi:hypothetical protein